MARADPRLRNPPSSRFYSITHLLRRRKAGGPQKASEAGDVRRRTTGAPLFFDGSVDPTADDFNPGCCNVHPLAEV